MANANLIPNAVAQHALQERVLAAKAWRTYLGLTQVAKCMGINRDAYRQLVSSKNLRKTSRAKIAAALGITDGQLGF